MNRSKGRFSLFFFFLSGAFFALYFLTFSLFDAHSLNVDESVHLTHALTVLAKFHQNGGGAFFPALTTSAYYPPLAPYLQAFFGALLGPFRPYLLLGNFFSILAAAALLLLYGARRDCLSMAAFSASFLLLLPSTLYLATHAYPEAYLFPWVAALLFFDRPLHTAKEALLLGAVLGLGFLSKWTYPLFVFFPLLALVLKTPLKRGGLFLIPSLVALFLIFPWIALNHFVLFRLLFYANQLGLKTGDPSPFSLAFYTYYPTFLLTQLAGVFFLLYLFQLVVARSKTSFWVFSTLLLFTLVYNKDPRFIAPLLPLLLLEASAALFQLFHKRWLLFFLLLTLPLLYRPFLPLLLPRKEPSLESLGKHLFPSLRPGERVAVLDARGKVHPWALQYALVHESLVQGKSPQFLVLFDPSKLCTAGLLVVRGVSSLPCSGVHLRRSWEGFTVWELLPRVK